MRRSLTLLSAVAATALMAAPASAYCGAVGGSSALSCEQGVRVVRGNIAPMPGVSPAQAAQIRLQKQQLQLAKQRQNAQIALARRQADQRDKELELQSYLYKGAYSPLRQRGYQNAYGYNQGGFGFYNHRGVIVVGGGKRH